MGHIPDPAFCPCGIIVNGGELQKQKEKKNRNHFREGKDKKYNWEMPINYKIESRVLQRKFKLVDRDSKSSKDKSIKDTKLLNSTSIS